jgi:hypothetical protein
MVEVPIKLDDSWGPAIEDAQEIEVPHGEAMMTVGIVQSGKAEIVEAHPGTRVEDV